MSTPPLIEVETKVWWESRAIWLNTAGFGVLIIGIILDSSGNLGISDQALAWLGVLLTILNAWLRFSTNQPISVHRDDTAVVTAGTGGAETPAFISNRMLHEENVELADKLGNLDSYLRDLRADLAPRRPAPADHERIFTEQDAPASLDTTTSERFRG